MSLSGRGDDSSPSSFSSLWAHRLRETWRGASRRTAPRRGHDARVRDVTLTQQYVCQIHSQRHIDVRALERGYLEEIPVKEGQAVKAGDVLFRALPTLYQAKLDAELAEAQLAQLEFNNTSNLFAKKVVSQNEVALHQAKLAKAQANAKLAGAELNFTIIARSL